MFERIRPYLPTVVFLVLISYFAYHAFTGDRGLLNEAARERALSERTAKLEALRLEHKELEQRVRLLSDEHMSRDLLEERARVLLGYVDKRDYLVRVSG